MARISNQSAYPAVAPQADDYLIGTDESQSFATKTFALSDISTFVNSGLPQSYVTLDTFQQISGRKNFDGGIDSERVVIQSAGSTNSQTSIANIVGNFLSATGTNGFGFNEDNNIYFTKDNSFGGKGGILAWNNTLNRTYTLPDSSGILALTTDLNTLNASNITTGTLADARLSSNVALKDVDNNFSVGQTIGGDVSADSFIKSGGTSSQFLMADGSVSSGASGGGSLVGTQYVYVTASGTDTENATELQNAYNTAKTMSPSATNRITVVCGMGNYNFSSNFVMDTQYIDLVSLDGNRSIIFNGSGTISITANNVFVKGVDVLSKSFTIGDNLNLIKVENCKGGTNSFGESFLTVSGTFTDCIGGQFSFGSQGTASGTFTNCQASLYSFASYGTASGTFTNCQGLFRSFGSREVASGTFTNCQGGDESFGGYGGTASGIFKDCQGGDESFGGYEGTASGTFNNCEGANQAFGYGGTASGTFENCTGDSGSFGGSGAVVGTLTGKLFYCRLTDGTFPTVSGAGITRLCLDGNNNENNQG